MLLEALERLVANSVAAPFLRVFAWWVLLQNWATLRFPDHRGLSPSDISVPGRKLNGKLSRSKTIGADRSIQSRQALVSSCCCVGGTSVDASRLEATRTSSGLSTGLPAHHNSNVSVRCPAGRAALRRWLCDP